MKRELDYNEIAEGITSGKYWHTLMMSEEERKTFAFIQNFKPFNTMSSTQLINQMEDNGIVAFMGSSDDIDPTFRVRGYHVYERFLALSGDDMATINAILGKDDE